MITKSNIESTYQIITKHIKNHFNNMHKNHANDDNMCVIDMHQFGFQSLSPYTLSQKPLAEDQGIVINNYGCDLNDLNTYMRKIIVSMKQQSRYNIIFIIFGFLLFLDLWGFFYPDSNVIDKFVFTGCICMSIGIILMTIISNSGSIISSTIHTTYQKKSIINNYRLLFGEICTLSTIIYKLIISLMQLIVFYRIIRLSDENDTSFIVSDTSSCTVFPIVYAMMMMMIGIDHLIHVVCYLLGAFCDIYLLIYRTKISIMFKLNEVTKIVFLDDSICYEKSHQIHYDEPEYHEIDIQSQDSLKYRINFSKKSDYDQRFDLDNMMSHYIDCENQTGKKQSRIIHATRLVDTRRLVLALCYFVLSYCAIRDSHMTIYTSYEHMIQNYMCTFAMIHMMCGIFIGSVVMHLITEICGFTYFLLTDKNNNKYTKDDQWAMRVVRFSFSFSNNIILGCFTMFLRDMINIKIYNTTPHCALWLIGVLVGYFCQISAYIV